MKLTFIGAANGIRLAKTYEANKVIPYPFIRECNSSTIEINSIKDLFIALQQKSLTGEALLKGNLDRPLIKESRAGHTNPIESTSWVCLDLDFEEGFESPKAFLNAIGVPDVAFVFQHSNSAGVGGKSIGLRGHVFFLLGTPVAPMALKHWLANLNLTIPVLRDQVSLNAAGLALKFPLDISTCQNDKLLYISPPTCVDFDDPIETRFLFYSGRPCTSLSKPPNPEATRTAITRCVSKLRSEAGLEKKTPKTRVISGIEVLTNPDRVNITGVQEARGFLYFNFNGGDSWAYYTPKDNPELVYNFKGEPPVRLKDIAPTYYYSLKGSISEPSTFPFVFRDPITDTYYNGIHSPLDESVLFYPVASKSRLADFLIQYGIQPADSIEDWEVRFDPTTSQVIDKKLKWVNQFSPTNYIRNATITSSTTGFPVINSIITSICVDAATKEHFINWLAYIFQTRRKTGTAWILQGTQGTGKGLLFSKILSPLLGETHCHQVIMERFDDQFNAYLERNIILFIDEANVDDSTSTTRTLNKLKNLITERIQVIRAMRANPVLKPIYCNLIFASNQHDIVPIDPSDRRFNVAPRQESPLEISAQEVDRIIVELQEFANYLYSYAVEEERVHAVLLNDARQQLINLSETSVEAFFHAVIMGDLGYFTQFLRTAPPDNPLSNYLAYERLIRTWIVQSLSGLNESRKIPRDDLATAYSYLQNTTVTPSKFTRMCNLHHLDVKNARLNGYLIKAATVAWVTPIGAVDYLPENTNVSQFDTAG